MTRLLLRLFVKNYDRPDAPGVHASVGSLAGIVGILCNAFLFAFKLAIGLISGAVSILADAMNNLSDAASSVVTLLGFRLAQRPADRDHPYGHARYEYLSGLIVAVLILLIGVELGETALRKIWNPTSLSISIFTIVVLVCSIAVKLWMSLFFRSLGKRIGSTALKVASVDCRNDVIASCAVLAGCIVEKYFSIPIDGYIGLGVALFILWSGVGVVRETISPLLGQRADQELLEKINRIILSNEKVLGVHDLLVHDYGPGQCFASVHVELSAREDPLVCHDLIDTIEQEALEALNVHLVIHYDPVVENDAEWNTMRDVVEKILCRLDPGLSMHDFRIVRGEKQPKLAFDLAVPYSRKKDHKMLENSIQEDLLQGGWSYTVEIRFDDKP